MTLFMASSMQHLCCTSVAPLTVQDSELNIDTLFFAYFFAFFCRECCKKIMNVVMTLYGVVNISFKKFQH
jgi:hypothetical protein